MPFLLQTNSQCAAFSACVLRTLPPAPERIWLRLANSVFILLGVILVGPAARQYGCAGALSTSATTASLVPDERRGCRVHVAGTRRSLTRRLDLRQGRTIVGRCTPHTGDFGTQWSTRPSRPVPAGLAGLLMRPAGRWPDARAPGQMERHETPDPVRLGSTGRCNSAGR